MIQFDEWFDKRAKMSPIRNLFICWLENGGVQGIYDATFEPNLLEEEWLSFLFYIGRKMQRVSNTMKGGLMEEETYYEIRHADNEELLEAAIHFWKENIEDEYSAYYLERWMRLGFALAQEDGWERVAPAWLSDWRKHIEILF